MNRIRKSHIFLTSFVLFLAFLTPFSPFVSINSVAAGNLSLSQETFLTQIKNEL